ncbi:endopolyphosphatase [Aspergillus novofumigatus IBT 16806]|uniref:Endopolyphosphatase n=1 Tax=Aspergillus novofumigatus (strain IBT 16806) TaxID=1392255 RepID=A0A2I1C9D1_ASPN1|nr:putative vacuolar endopolyphosphatase [Aspergillus novofumigatus IBT 16806]PKX94224.1 putative vacuolar endopolyphosphatase [Aspergillus novofumigatus IBT 16806]
MIPYLFLQGILVASVTALPVLEQQPLGLAVPELNSQSDGGMHLEKSRRLHGRFLHITDLHPDPHYKTGSSSDDGAPCHRGKGSAEYFGAEGSDCDSPFSLVNETFSWIEKNLKGNIDFVLWTGDSARHDNDEKIPRTEDEVVRLNEMLADKFVDVFGDKRFPNGLSIPIVPTIGNNDIMPHNILREGPNRWTKRFQKIWSKFIPEHELHTFVEGGWFTSEVIPNKLTAISLNTMYFFDSNSAVDGCKAKSQPGYEHMEWLRVQLQLLRERGMKAILIGHVPPARTDSKRNWDESCWQKYALWVHQYRDVIVGSVYGHMNIDHFILQDHHNVNIVDADLNEAPSEASKDATGDASIRSRSGYLSDLRHDWSKLPSPPPNFSMDNSTLDDWFGDGAAFEDDDDIQFEKSKKKRRQFLKKIGGPWAERYSVSLVSPSVVPNYFPSLRIVEYNITGLENIKDWAATSFAADTPPSLAEKAKEPRSVFESVEDPDMDELKKGKKDKKKKKKKKKKPSFKVPEPPSPTAPPGPAYSNQPLTWLGYTQYFANLTKINNEYSQRHGHPADSLVNETRGKDLFTFEVEYDTMKDDIYKLEDLTVRSHFKLASRIAKKASAKDQMSETGATDDLHAAIDNDGDDFGNMKDVKGKKIRNRVWKTFLKRAFVGYYRSDEIDEIDD